MKREGRGSRKGLVVPDPKCGPLDASPAERLPGSLTAFPGSMQRNQQIQFALGISLLPHGAQQNSLDTLAGVCRRLDEMLRF